MTFTYFFNLFRERKKKHQTAVSKITSQYDCSIVNIEFLHQYIISNLFSKFLITIENIRVYYSL